MSLSFAAALVAAQQPVMARPGPSAEWKAQRAAADALQAKIAYSVSPKGRAERAAKQKAKKAAALAKQAEMRGYWAANPERFTADGLIKAKRKVKALGQSSPAKMAMLKATPLLAAHSGTAGAGQPAVSDLPLARLFSSTGARPVSLQMGQGGWAKQGFFGVSDLLKVGKWGLGKLKGGSQGPGPRQIGPPVVKTPGFKGATERFLPGGASGYESAPMNGNTSGMHLNKSDYFLKSGEFVAAGTKWVKNRRRNSLNPRALSRAIGRLEGAKRASRRIGDITIRNKCATPRRRAPAKK